MTHPGRPAPPFARTRARLSRAARAALRAALVVAGLMPAHAPQAAGGRPAPMTGPDFIMARVAAWSAPAGEDGRLVLVDGSRWRLAAGRRDGDAQAGLVALAKAQDEVLLVSGDRAAGLIDRVDLAQRLAVAEIDEREKDGRVLVTFHRPAPVFHVRTSRPDAQRILALLRGSLAAHPPLDQPDLLVGIDTVHSEVLAVQPWTAGTASTDPR